MKRLLLFLLALCALPLGAIPSVTAIALNTAPGAIGYSTIMFTASSSGFYDWWQVRVSTSSCASGTGGTIQPYLPASPTTPVTTGYNVIVGGLAAGTHYFMCFEISDTGSGGPFSTGASGEVQGTTLSVVENEPRPISKFNSDYPNTGDFATMPVCPTLNAQNYCRVNVSLGTTSINSVYDTAIGAQCGHGTVIAMAHSATPTLFTQNIFTTQFVSCSSLFWDSAKIVGNEIHFGTPHGLVEGELLTFGQHGFQTPPTSSSCYYGAGFLVGSRFLTHVINTTDISLLCGDGSNNPVVISSPGSSAANNLFLLPHPLVSGQCPDVKGTVACTYPKVNSYEVIIRSDAADSLLPPPGTPISPKYCAAGLCSIWINPVANVANASSTAFFFNPGNNDGNVHPMTANVRFGPGIEVTNEIDPSQRTYATMVSTPSYGSDNTVDRVYMHGGDTTPPVLQRWGGPSFAAAKWEGYNTSVQDSYIDNLRQWHNAPTDGDGSSMLISQGPGPVHFLRNHIEGAGIPLHADGGETTIAHGTYVFGDIQILRNYWHAPTFMMMGSADSDGHWSGHRQLLEGKAGLRWEVAGNRFDTQWTENNPNSEWIVWTSVSSDTQGIGVTDVNTFSNSFIHGPGGIGMPIVVYGGNIVTIPPARFAFRNNYFNDIDSRWWANGGVITGPKGWWFQGPGSGEGAIIDHNTWVGNTNTQIGAWIPVISRFQNTPFAGWSYTNNFSYNFTSNGYGINQEGGVGVGPCFNLIAKAFADACLTPSYTWKGNVMMSPSATAAQIATNWPTIIADNYNPTNMSLAVTPGWLDYNTTGNGGNYRLKPTSDYRSSAPKTLTTGPATDMNDVGVDWTKIQNDQGHVEFASVSPIGTVTASVNFNAPDNLSCPVSVTTTAPWTSSTVPTSGVVPFTDSGTVAGARKVDLTGLTTGTLYYGIVNCAVEQPTFQFKTR